MSGKRSHGFIVGVAESLVGGELRLTKLLVLVADVVHSTSACSISPIYSSIASPTCPPRRLDDLSALLSYSHTGTTHDTLQNPHRAGRDSRTGRLAFRRAIRSSSSLEKESEQALTAAFMSYRHFAHSIVCLASLHSR